MLHVAWRAMVLPALVLSSSIRQFGAGNRKVLFYALHTSSATILKSAHKRLNSSHFEFVSIPAAERFGAIPVHSEYSRATYMRLMLPQLLPDVKRIIYLDMEPVVTRSLSTL